MSYPEASLFSQKPVVSNWLKTSRKRNETHGPQNAGLPPTRKHLACATMEDDIEPLSGSSMVPLALALLAIVLGGSGLYFGLTASQQLAPLSESIDAGSSSSARIDQQLSSLETRLVAISTHNDELKKTVERLRIYGTQSEQMAKQAAAGVKANRDELVKLAETMKELTTSGTPRPSTASAPSATADSLSAAPVATGSSSIYVIKSGDTFAKIASLKGVSLGALLDANPEADPRRLRIGQEINIPAN